MQTILIIRGEGAAVHASARVLGLLTTLNVSSHYVSQVKPLQWDKCAMVVTDRPQATAIAKIDAPNAMVVSSRDLAARLGQCLLGVAAAMSRHDSSSSLLEHIEEELDAVADETLWHDLKNSVQVEESLFLLKSIGFIEEAAEYETLLASDIAAAQRYAERQFNRTRLRGKWASPHALVPQPDGDTDKQVLRVLVVDDQDYWAEWLSGPLQEVCRDTGPGLEILISTAHNREEATKALQSNLFNAIVLDYILGDGKADDSLNLAEWLAESEFKPIPVYGLTGRRPVRRSDGSWSQVSPEWKVRRVFFKEMDEASEPYELATAIVHETVPDRIRDAPFLIRIVVFARKSDFCNHVRVAWRLPLREGRSTYELQFIYATTCGRAERLLYRNSVHALLIGPDVEEDSAARIAQCAMCIHDGLLVYRALSRDSEYLYVLDLSGQSFSADHARVELVRRVAERARTPFFSALRAYAAKPTAVFHALPLSRGKGISASQWTGPFWQFFGAGYFSAETSATMPPLDSLFHPVGSLRDAMDFAARAFHSQRTEFCTNGTTGANHIVYRALLQPGDVVLQDRNCHQSHHYAALMSRARVSYLEPHHLDQYGISTLVRLEEIRRQLLRYPKGTVRLLAITHPTFDGVCYDPETIMRLTYEHDPNLVLLFDEAWFAYGAFHPKFKRLSAMCAAEKLWAEGKRVRVYVTQSTHKTLSAMRQGSMIHVRDPLFDDVVKRPFEEALKAMVTTSPNASILASLDVARMQAEMEGYDRIARACSIARWIRSELAEGHCRILSEEDLCSGIDRREAMLDPLKLTLYCGGQHGSFVREQRLFKERGIQVNKFSHNTVLLLVTIATTWSMADYLIRAIRDISTQTLQIHGGDLNLRLPCFSGFHPAFLNHSECSVSGPGDLAKAFDALVRDVRDPMLLDLAGPDPTIVPQGAVSVTYVTPYPPGYPVLVPGQLIDGNCVSFLCELMRGGMKTIHGLVHSKSGGCCLPYALLSEDTVL